MTQDNQANDTRPMPGRFTSRQQAFFKSEAAMIAKDELKLMANDPRYNTQGIFSAQYAQDMSFVERHMKYLSEHPKLDPRHYLSNLKLMTKVKY